MSRCNLDFFDTKLSYVFHDSAETPGVDIDYLTPESSQIEIGETNLITEKMLVRVEEHNDYLAVVDNVSKGEGKTTISVKPFLSIFDQAVMFDTNWQYTSSGSTGSSLTLEDTIATLINQYWIQATDTPQNMPLAVYTTSSTTNWSFGLVGDKADDESATDANNHYCVVEFYDTILQNALMRYRVAIETELDLNTKTINLYIGAPTSTKIVEADLADVTVVDFTVGKLESDTNKLEIWNDENYTEKIYYYLHTDGTYDTDSSVNRITPIKMEVLSCRKETDSDGTVTKTFATVAKEQADQRFGDIQWKNHIELDISIDNLFGTDLTMQIGQLVKIMYQGKTYETILTGKVLGDVLTLIFGTLRVDLTKKLQLDASVEYTTAKSVYKHSSTSSN